MAIDDRNVTWKETAISADVRDFDLLAEAVLVPMFEQLHAAVPGTRAYYLWDEASIGSTAAHLRIRAEVGESGFPLSDLASSCVRRAGLDARIDDALAEPVYHAALLTTPWAREMLHDFYSETNDLLLRCVIRSNLAARRMFAFDLLASDVTVLSSVVNESAVSRLFFMRLFGEFAEFFFYQSRDPAAARRRFAALYEQMAATVSRRVAAAPSDARLDEWSGHLRRYWSRVTEGLASKSLLPIEDDDLGARRSLAPESGAFAADIYQRRSRFPGRGFDATRILVSLGLWTVMRLGVPLLERYLLCYSLGAVSRDGEVSHAR